MPTNERRWTGINPDGTPQRIAEAWYLVTQLAMRELETRGYANLREYPGILELELESGRWKFEIHAQDQEIDGLKMPDVRIHFNGWPAGVMGPGGGLMAAGEVANEDAMIATLKQALEEEVRA